MNRLDRSKEFGKITPPWQDDSFDRPAYYEQGGRLYDAHDRLIEPGKPVSGPDPVPVAIAEPEPDNELMPAATLLAQADSMAWAKFRSEAKKILGTTCPAGKEDIKRALADAVAAVEAKLERSKPKSASSPGLTWDGVTGGSEAAKGGAVDLAAWAMGKREYLFGEVQKAIRTAYHKQVTERRDAVDFLVEQKVIAAASARRDVYA